jgi:hypothetical protein
MPNPPPMDDAAGLNAISLLVPSTGILPDIPTGFPADNWCALSRCCDASSDSAVNFVAGHTLQV